MNKNNCNSKTRGKSGNKRNSNRKPFKQSARSSKYGEWDEAKNSRNYDADGKYNAITSKENDWRWYAQNEQLLRDSASFSYNYPLGSKITWTPTGSKFADTYSVPGICALYTAPAFGNAVSATDPLTIAVRNIYTYVRHANAGHTNYDAPDLGIYLLAMDSIYSYIAYLKRLYGVMQTWSYTNRYYAQAMVQAMDGNYNDLKSNLADFRAFINRLVVQAGSLVVPASMSYFARHIWMYSGYYVDTDNNDKAQTYLYVPEMFYQFGLGTDGAGLLRPINFLSVPVGSSAVDTINDGHTLAELITYGENLLKPILDDEDINIMSGDILKAFGPSNVVKIEGISETYTVLPSYSMEVLDQINNATMLGRSFNVATTPMTNNENLVVQDQNHEFLTYTRTSFMYLQPQVNNVHVQYSGIEESLTAKRMINFQHGDIKPEDTMVASRLTNIPSSVEGSSQPIVDGGYGTLYYGMTPGGYYETVTCNVDTVASDVVCCAKLWYYAYPNRGTSNIWSLIHSEDIYSTILSTVSFLMDNDTTPQSIQNQIVNISQKNADDFRRVALLSVFDRHPAVAQIVTYNIQSTNTSFIISSSGTMPFNGVINDVNYYTLVDAENLQTMALTALLSMFNVTQYGKSDVK